MTSPTDAQPPAEPVTAPVAESAPASPPRPSARGPLIATETSVPRPSARGPLIATAITTAAVTAASYLTPDKYAATLVGMTFLAATWWLVLRHDEATVRAYALSLGGLLEPARLEPKRLTQSAIEAVAWMIALAVLIFPFFWAGFVAWLHVTGHWHKRTHFELRLPPSVFDEIAGQLVVIALPEEAFFRGYLQTSLDRTWPPRWRILGADLGPGWLLASAIFAVGHVLTIDNPARLAVFFPALVFGWLRAKTRGIGASVAFHAACNLFSAFLGRGYA